MWMLNKLPTREERVAGAYVGASMKSHFLSIFLFNHKFLPTGSRLIESGVVSGLKM